MRNLIMIGLFLLATSANGYTTDNSFLFGAVAETRCGWFLNPTPSNAWLIDAADEWTISVQMGYQAEGEWPEFSDSQWVKTNGYYGYGCACMNVTTNKKQSRIVKINSAKPRPLSACRNDKAIKGKEPKE